MIFGCNCNGSHFKLLINKCDESYCLTCYDSAGAFPEFFFPDRKFEKNTSMSGGKIPVERKSLA